MQEHKSSSSIREYETAIYKRVVYFLSKIIQGKHEKGTANYSLTNRRSRAQTPERGIQ